MQSRRVIPLLYLRSSVALGRKCEDWHADSDGEWQLPDVWLNRRSLELPAQTSTCIRADRRALRGRGHLDRFRCTRRAFERANEDQTTALVAQFRREFNRRGDEVAHQVETIAASEAATRMALAVSRGSADYSGYVNQAKALADNQQLDFLEFADSDGTILSSAQWPAKFGYKDTSLPLESPPPDAFLRQEELPDGVALSLSAIRQVRWVTSPST